MPILAAELKEGAAVRDVAVGGVGLAPLAVASDAIALKVAQVRIDSLRADA